MTPEKKQQLDFDIMVMRIVLVVVVVSGVCLIGWGAWTILKLSGVI